MTQQASFRIELADYATQQALLHGVRATVFVEEQQVPVELEVDALDPVSCHVLALDADGHAIGTGRLTPDQRIGRMAVLPQWRGHGVGDAMLKALISQARARDWNEVSLHAQLGARDFYVRHGFLPQGPHFEEAGIAHQTMCLHLSGHAEIDNLEAAVAITCAIVARARRRLLIHSRDLDAGLLDHPSVVEAMRRFATAHHEKQVLILVHDAMTAQRMSAPLLALAQRLPSVFQIREPSDPVDRNYPSAFVVNDVGDSYFRLVDHRIDGEARLAQRARAQQLDDGFGRMWERSRECTELRALGI